mmetsp:Transcript_12103/g.19700  ORF Transcript_12103/g.19700 Transcript_12103/m.19700 type:complete len:533 (+) Transcript_12103:82-1680(+)
MAATGPSYKYTIFAVGVGNALEWYDFAIFGALADVFGFHFFPLRSKGTQLLAAFSVYCSAFFMRPLGGMLFGHIGDTKGRKRALEISIGLMILVSFAIGVLPTYDMIGYTATVLLVLLRMMQGVAVGGEMVGAYIYTVEGCRDHLVAYWSGVCKSTGLFGTVLGMGFVALLRECLPEEQFFGWGWRVPFLSSVVMGGLGVHLRSYLKESQEFAATVVASEPSQATQQAKQQQEGVMSRPGPGAGTGAGAVVASRVVVWDVLRFHWPEIMSVGLIVAFWANGFYTAFIWMAYYTSQLMRDGEYVPHPWLINTMMMGVFVVMMPSAGLLADGYVSRHIHLGKDVAYRRCMIVASLGVVLLACPVFYLINIKTVLSTCAGYTILSVGLALYGTCLPVVMVRQFKIRYRYTAMGVAYNVANAIFAGTAPLVQTSLVLHVHSPSELVDTSVVPAASLMVVGLLSILSLAAGPALCQYIRTVCKMPAWRGAGMSTVSAISMSSSTSAGLTGSDLDCSVSSQSSESSALDTSCTPMLKI